jgi:hypothetical protein
LYTGPGGGLYTGPGGGMYTGADDPGYMSNIPPWEIFAKYLAEMGMENQARFILSQLQ